jgi:tetratricopeptide (TPR) repeat protein
MALVYEAQGKFRQALAIYDKLLKNGSGGGTDSIRFARAGLYSTMGRLDPALQDFSSLAGKKGDQNRSVKAFYYVGCIYELKKSPDQALKSYKAAVEEATYGWSKEGAQKFLTAQGAGKYMTDDLLTQAQKQVEDMANFSTDGFLARAREKIKALEGRK